MPQPATAAASPVPVIQPAEIGTPIAGLATPITTSNAAGLVEIARWGKGPARSGAFSPDGKWIAFGSPIGITIYDAGSYAQTAFVDTHSSVTEIAFSPDGRTLAAGLGTHDILLVDTASWTTLRSLTGHSSEVESVAFSPDSRLLISGGADLTGRIWDVASGAQVQMLKGHQNIVSHVLFFPDGRTAATSSLDATVKLWDVSSGQLLKTLGEGNGGGAGGSGVEPFGPIVTAAGGAVLVWLRATDTAYEMGFWDVASGKEIKTIGNLGDLGGLAATADGKKIALVYRTNETVTMNLGIFDGASGSQIATFDLHSSLPGALAFSPDGRTLLAASSEDAAVLLDAGSGGTEHVFDQQTGGLRELALSADGKTVVARYQGAGVSALRIFEIASGTSRSVPLSRCDAMALSPDGSTVAVACMAPSKRSAAIEFYDVSSGQQRSTLDPSVAGPAFANGLIQELAYSPDGKLLAVVNSQGFMRTIDLAAGTAAGDFGQQSNSSGGLAFSPDGKLLAAGSVGNTAAVWDAATAKLLYSVLDTYAVRDLAFSPDSKTLVTGTDTTYSVPFWDAASGKQLRTADGAIGVKSISFSSDGSLLITGSGDGHVLVWDFAAGKVLASLGGHTASVVSTIMSRDGAFIVSGSDDGTIRLWALPPPH